MASVTMTQPSRNETVNGENLSVALEIQPLCSPPGFSFGVPSLDMGIQDRPVVQIRYPRFASFEDERNFRKLHHAAALRWLGTHGFGEEGAGGHMTVRDPEFSEYMWINPFGRSFKHLTPDDLVLLNEKGVVVGGNMHAVNPAGYWIHSAVHRARPDVQAVVHCHTIPGKAFSSFGKPLEMYNQDCCQFFESNTVYEGFDGIVLASEEGERIAKALGPTNKAIILQNHGLLAVGKSPDAAAFTFGALDRCLDAQFLTENMAQATGLKPIPVTDKEARQIKSIYTDEFQYLTFQPAFEDVIRDSNGALNMKSGGEIYPAWNDI